MTTETTVQPALTPEEWRASTITREQGGAYANARYGLCVWSPGAGVGVRESLRHAVAALCLYGQPYGFTREDVQNLRALAQECEFATPHVSPDEIARAIAAKIAALLPPE